ncbi:L,D-transpeptidase [Clostridium psychrophilum]|uniref:L,D-transpeptidase n=1 Tax=Clostridium psychrophilum TaxID=132926 RepID=UPI001C0CC404|nr:L,D-transpeptidase [Clostridium psychrophilum]MBU3180880.1 L,D-transpeptidase [Clostridium psychrophilum]
MYKPATQSLLTADDIANKSIYEKELNSVDSTSNTNNYILVNIYQQKVYIFSGCVHNWKLINIFSCGSGKSSTPTVTGHFRVGVKGLCFKSGASVYCKYFSQISGNYLFHSILYDRYGNVIDGNLGTVESHGCIRLALKSAKYIYDNVPIGSSIWIK